MAPKPNKKADKEMQDAISPMHRSGDKRKMAESPVGQAESKTLRGHDDQPSPPPFATGSIGLEDFRTLLLPMQAEISSLRSELNGLKSDIVSSISSVVEPLVVQHVQTSTAHLDSEISEIRSRLEKLTLREDIERCKLQAVLHNVPAGLDRSDFRSFLDNILPGTSVSSVRLISDKDRSKGTSTCFATFETTEKRSAFVSEFRKSERSYTQNGSKFVLSAKSCIPTVWRERNNALRKKLDSVKSQPSSSGAVIDWKNRTICSGGKVLCRQKRDSHEFDTLE